MGEGVEMVATVLVSVEVTTAADVESSTVEDELALGLELEITLELVVVAREDKVVDGA